MKIQDLIHQSWMPAHYFLAFSSPKITSTHEAAFSKSWNRPGTRHISYTPSSLIRKKYQMSSWSFFESVMLSLHLPILEWFVNKNGSNRKVWEFQLLYMILFSCCLKLKGGFFFFFLLPYGSYFFLHSLFLVHKLNYHFVRSEFCFKLLYV